MLVLSCPLAALRVHLCAASWATWLLITHALAPCVVLLGSCSRVCWLASGRAGEQEPSDLGHRARNATHGRGTPVNRSQVARHTAQGTQHTKHAHWRT